MLGHSVLLKWCNVIFQGFCKAYVTLPNLGNNTPKLYACNKAKFGYSEKATKFEKIFHLKFDATQ